MAPMPLFESLKKALGEIEKEELIILCASVFSGLTLVILNMLYIAPVAPLVGTVMNILAGVIVLTPPSVVRYSKYTKIRSMEERFPDFLRDVVEGLRGGMTLPLAVEYVARGKYGALTPYIRQLAAALSWGVPFEKALENFAAACKSRIISRAVSTIIECHRSGGEIPEVLASVGAATVEIDKIKKERTSRIYGQMTSGYMIFFIFIAVMVGMQRFLLPALAYPAITPAGAEAQLVGAATLGAVFSHLAVIQGVFAGLAIGMMATGTITAGLKHALIMALIGYTVVTLGGAAPGPGLGFI